MGILLFVVFYRKASFANPGLLHLVLQIWQSCFSKKKSTPNGVLFFLEVPARFELANESFADSCLTTWPRYHMK